MEFNLADLFEAAVDAFPGREYLAAGGRRLTYAEMDQRANRLAHHLRAAGIGPGDHVGIYALNSAEWVETAWAVFKLRAVWININYRYVEDELRYLFSNADLVALVHQRQFSPRVAALLPELPDLRHVIVIDDDSEEPDPRHDAVDYEDAMAEGGPERDFEPRSGDDLYILYTGGTTGMPKGVVWQHRNVFYALGGGIDALTGVRVERPQQMVEKGLAAAGQISFLPIAPLMHGASQWAVMGQSFVGNKITLVPRFEPHEIWATIEREKINMVMITGDAMGKPLIEALDDPGASYDLSSLIGITSTAALFSPAVKDAFFNRFPNLIMTDAIGSSEGGNNGISMIKPGGTAMKSGPTVSSTGGTVVFDENLEPVKPGSGVIGKIARSGDIPICYYNDPVKSAEVFISVEGRPYVMPGDFATVEADGSVTLLGRGSICINSGGEKIFPEEVESIVRSHPDVMDAIVVGAPDERFGQRVAAIVEPRPGRPVPTLEAVQ
ncbi:MAG TPA: acyl-CoA synthetase, partial [Acidimicrobiales bacterium]|nr:acyl-CoA synthetase [Acidimicrobiales bacterium]